MDIEQLVEVAAVVIPFEDTEIQPCADDAGDQSGKNTIHQLAGIDVVTRRALVAVHYGEQQADRDDQAVPINLETAKLERDAVDREVPSEKRKANVKNIHISLFLGQLIMVNCRSNIRKHGACTWRKMLLMVELSRRI